jgi:hypothetical protein
MNRLAKWLLSFPVRAPRPRTDRPGAKPRIEPLEDRVVPDGRPLPFPVIFAGADAGGSPLLRAYAADTGALNFERAVFEDGFSGGVHRGRRRSTSTSDSV